MIPSGKASCSRCGEPILVRLAGSLCDLCLSESIGRENWDAPTDFFGDSDASGRRIGNYRLIRKIGGGGQGEVWEAFQEAPIRRRVALKLLRGALFPDRGAVQRLFREAQNAARIGHPGIITIHDVGEVDGEPYLCMGYVDGPDLATRIKGRASEGGAFDPRDAARIVRLVAMAIGAAHAKDVLHRDLKPSNILLGFLDQPLIVDFGLARNLEESLRETRTGEILGTPGYLSPEQARGIPSAVSRASDIYSLGAILYELLTGRPPFLGVGLAQIVDQVIRSEPVPPRRTNASIPSEIESICLKCLEKNPARRYPTAEALADDLERFLEHRPVRARRVSWFGRGLKWSRRHPGWASAVGIGIAALAMILGLLVTEAGRERQRVGVQRQALAEVAFERGESADGLLLLRSLAEERPEDHVRRGRLDSALSTRRWAIPLHPPMRHPTGSLIGAAHLPGSSGNVVTAGSDGMLRRWSVEGIETAAARVGSPVTSFAVDESGRWVAAGTGTGGVAVLDARSWETLPSGVSHAGRVTSVAFDSSGTVLAAGGGNGEFSVLDVPSGRVRFRRERGGRATEAPCAVAFSAPDESVIFGTAAGEVVAWGVVDGVERWSFRTAPPIRSLRCRPDRGWVLVVAGVGRVQLWRVGREPVLVQGWTNSAKFHHADFSPDASLVAMGGESTEVAVCRAETGLDVARFKHREPVWKVAFSHDGRRLASASDDFTARVWSLASEAPGTEPIPHSAGVVSVEFAKDDRSLLTASNDGTAGRWDLRYGGVQPRVLEAESGGELNHVAWDRGRPGHRLIAASESGRAWILPLGVDARPRPVARGESAVQIAEFLDDGTRALVGRGDGALEIWNVDSGERLESRRVHSNVIWTARPDPGSRSRRWLTASEDGTALVWNLDPLEPVVRVSHARPLTSAEFGPDGSRFATSSRDDTAVLWDSRSGERLGPPMQHAADVNGVKFSPDGGMVLTFSDLAPHAALWSARNAALIRTLAFPRRVSCGVFGHDGRRVALGSGSGHVTLWSTNGALLAETRRMDHEIRVVDFSPDDRWLLTVSDAGEVRVWDVASGSAMTEVMAHGALVWSAWFRPDGRGFITAGYDGRVKDWPWWDTPVDQVPVLSGIAESIAFLHPSVSSAYGAGTEGGRPRRGLAASRRTADWMISFLMDPSRRTASMP